MNYVPGRVCPFHLIKLGKQTDTRRVSSGHSTVTATLASSAAQQDAAAIGKKWSLLSSPRIGHTALHLFQRHLLHCKYIHSFIRLLKPTGYVMNQHSTTVRSAHTVLMCFVFVWEQTAICATDSINWLIFITEMKSVYCAVRNGSLNKAVCCIYLRTNSDLCHLQHKLIGIYNRDVKCLLRCTNWVFK